MQMLQCTCVILVSDYQNRVFALIQKAPGSNHSKRTIHFVEYMLTAQQEGNKFPYFTSKPNISGLPGPTETSQYSN